MAEQLNDWRTMVPGLTLDWLIAEKAGWKIEGILPPPDKPGEKWYRVIDNEGLERPYTIGWPRPGGWPEYELDMILPRYSTDLNAAITLIRPDWAFMLSSLEPNRWHCTLNGISSKLRDHGDGMAETPALAVCRAYLEWQEKNPLGKDESEDDNETQP